MDQTKSSATAIAAEPELVITRVFDAPRSLVFDAWTKPAHLERWQGAPRGFTVTSNNVDMRPGGTYRICMRSPEGVDHWLQGVYREVVPYERLVLTHTWLDAEGKPGKETLLTVTFADHDSKTLLTLHQTGFKSVESRDGHNLGWNSMIDRFVDYLAEQVAQPTHNAKAS
jgi:uncharacterized protein YndB with AHSA1/START domain